MSEIRERIVKVLEESNISFMEEGWKDNMKKAAGVAAVAGGLMAGGAQAADKPMDYNDGAQADGQFTAYYQDDESPLAAQYQQRAQDDTEVKQFAKQNGFVDNGDGTYSYEGDTFDTNQIRMMIQGEEGKW